MGCLSGAEADLLDAHEEGLMKMFCLRLRAVETSWAAARGEVDKHVELAKREGCR